MARFDHDQMAAHVVNDLGAVEDPSGKADYTFDKGSLILAAEPKTMKAAFKRIKKVDGYRWVMINEEDLFAANTLSLGSKAGMITPTGKMLKNADIPRKKI